MSEHLMLKRLRRHVVHLARRVDRLHRAPFEEWLLAWSDYVRAHEHLVEANRRTEATWNQQTA